MNQKIDNWINQRDAVRDLFVNDFGEMSEGQLNWKPSPDTWSIAEIMEHIILLNTSYYPQIEAIVSGTYKLPFTARINFLVKQFGNIIYKYVQRDNPKKTRTMPMWVPQQSNVSGDIIKRYRDHHHEMKGVIGNCGELIEQGTIVSSPANRNIVYTLEKAFDIMIEHEFRHYKQAAAVKAVMP